MTIFRNMALVERLVLLLGLAVMALSVRAQSTFTPRYVDAAGDFLWWVAANATTLVTVGSNGALLTSTDAINWTRRSALFNGVPVRDWLVGVAHGQSFTTESVAPNGQQWIAVGDHGRIVRSTDAVTWTVVPHTVTTQRLNGIVFANQDFPAANAPTGLWIAVGEGGTIITSPDGLDWTLRASGVTGWLRGILPYKFGRASTPQNLYVCGQGGVILYTTDAITWKRALTSTTNDLEVMTYCLAILAAGENGMLITPLPTVLQPGVPQFVGFSQSRGTTARLRGMFTSPANHRTGVLFACGEDGTLISAATPTGPWKTLTTGTTANLVAGVAWRDSYILVGGATTRSGSSIVQTDNVYVGRLNNVSTRGLVDSNNRLLIAGLVIQGDKPKTVLLRAAGPALRTLGVNDSAASTQLAVFDATGRPIGANSGWMSGLSAAEAQSLRATFSQVGAFSFANNSADSALVLSLAPGNYTMQVRAADGGDGIALAEAYDLDRLAPLVARANNLSTRGYVGGGSQVLIAGLTIDGDSARQVLLRAVGPGLIPFGVNDALARPRLSLNQGQTVVATAGDLGSSPERAELLAAATAAGAFILTDNDSALLATLNPGSWTLIVSSGDTNTGTALVEAYILP